MNFCLNKIPIEELIILKFWFQSRHALEKLLDWENNHLYRKLGLHWQLAKERCDTSAMVEYVLLIEFIPRLQIHRPD